MRAPAAIASVGIVVAALVSPVRAQAQAVTPPAGTGSISVSFQSVNHTGHLLTDGSYIDNGRSLTGAAYVDIQYGITRRLAVAFAIPYVWARYTDDDPPPPFLPFLPIDYLREWNSSFQDFGFTARYNLIDTFDHVMVVTPIVSFGTPSHDYIYQGEAVVGRHMNEMRVGADANYRLDAISRNVSVTGHYTYAFVERVIDVGTNRSNASGAVDYQIGRNWSVGGFVAMQRTHGGLRVGAPGSALEPPGELNTPDRIDQHDRLLRENWWHIGVQASYRLGWANLFGSYTYVVQGTDAHAGHAVLGGVTMPFRLRK